MIRPIPEKSQHNYESTVLPELTEGDKHDLSDIALRPGRLDCILSEVVASSGFVEGVIIFVPCATAKTFKL